MRTRRWFLRTSGLAVGALGTPHAWIKPASAQGVPSRKVLVAVLQRGAADGLNIVIPFAEKRYYQLRPGIGIAMPGQPGGGGPIDLDGKFAFHQSLQALRPLWDAKQLAVVHAVGSPHTSRSHADAQAYMESGTADTRTPDGWLNRTLARPSQNSSPLRGVAVGATLPLALRGDRSTVAVDDLAKFQTIGEAYPIMERLYARAGDARLKSNGAAMFDAVKKIDAIRQQPVTPLPPAPNGVNGGFYQGEFGRRLQQLARLIKSDVGVEVAFVDIDGWDHHANENGQLGNILNQFSASLAAFTRDLGARMADVVVVTMSEFGRTAAENGNAGTDHGHGGVMMVMGGPVRGGSVYGKWPGLEQEQLFEGRDLAVTTDYRDVLSELVRVHLGQNPEQVFPGYKPGAPLGLLQNV
jgi:uncharacterized protein (DUF1501 family)